MTCTKGNIHDLEANPAWKEILLRVAAIETAADEAMENPEPYKNREATGERRVARTVATLPETLLRELA